MPRRCIAWLPILLCCCGLGPQQIALVVNRQQPASIKLAQAYAAARGIPDDRIITLDIPNGNEITFDQYEHEVVPPIRDFLRQRNLVRQVRCLVTFYGVPFRIRDRTDTGAEKQELADLRKRESKTIDDATPSVDKLEQITRTLDPAYRSPPKSPDMTPMQLLARRYEAAVASIAMHVTATTQPSDRKKAMVDVLPLIRQLGGDADIVDYIGPNLNGPSVAPDELQKKWTELRQIVLTAELQVTAAEQKRYDPEARAVVLKVTAEALGLIRLGNVMESQIDYLTPGLSNSALDSELSLLWLNYYPRSGPWLNPLHYAATSQLRPQVLMVSRLDAPDVPMVERMIQVSVDVEKKGLSGDLVVNSYGFANGVTGEGKAARTFFDHKFHNLAQIAEGKSNLIVHEEYSRYLTDHEATDTALYAGWYSLRRYIPGMRFAPGAVGYHVASLELLSLHEPTETGWVHGLLSDGCVATLGAVAEPYMAAFPPPDEFFPLLMTGKLTLAEVYWRTQLTSSWMMCLIGDPLYTPYRNNPAMKVEDLPAYLRPALVPIPATRYSSSRPQ